jgi:hypothetical protein
MSALSPQERGIDAAPERLLPGVAKPPAAPSASHGSFKKHLVGVTERSVSTFAFAFLGLITVTNLSDPAALKAAAVSGCLSVGVYLRGVAGDYLANTSDAG